MKLAFFLFSLLLGMCSILLIASCIAQGEGATGVAHPEIESMLISGPTMPGSIRVLGWCFGILQIAFFAGLFALGLGERAPRWIFIAGFILVASAFTGMVLADRSAGDAIVFSMPAPTAWMLYVLWPMPLIFMAYYVLKFREIVVTDEDLKRFEQLRTSKLSHLSGVGQAQPDLRSSGCT